MKIMKQSKETSSKFWKANSIAAGSASLKEGSPFRFIAESGTKATQHHDGALLEQIDLGDDVDPARCRESPIASARWPVVPGNRRFDRTVYRPVRYRVGYLRRADQHRHDR